MNTDRITEVSTTVDAGLSQDDLDAMSEAERLALVVGAAYGKALAERDEARAQVAHLRARLDEARTHLENTLGPLQNSTWANDSHLAGSIQAYLERVDSELTPAQED